MGSPTQVYSWGADGTIGHECGRALPLHLIREPVLFNIGMLLLEVVGVLPHLRPEGDHSGKEAGVRDSGALQGLPRIAQRSRDEFRVQGGS